MIESAQPIAAPLARPASRTLALVVCAALILVSGLLHGYLDGRWADRPDLQRIGEQLTQLPTQCGDWELASESQIDESAQELLRCYGSMVRVYWNPVTGQRVNAAVLFGPRGPIAVHTPEVCYSSQGTEPAGPRTAATITTGNRDDQFWKVQFRMRDSDQPHLEVWYGWSDGQAWHAANYPRVWMTDRLYKIQVAGNPPQQAGEKSPVADFLESFLPALNEIALSKV